MIPSEKAKPRVSEHSDQYTPLADEETVKQWVREEVVRMLAANTTDWRKNGGKKDCV